VAKEKGLFIKNYGKKKKKKKKISVAIINIWQEEELKNSVIFVVEFAEKEFLIQEDMLELMGLSQVG